ncbi:alpha/beta-hydrolase [Amylostereum chailletii]|nr:alpha/beta-hydrolase [Amylostereum chailletii]
MPYVDILSANDHASLWYITNTPSGNASDFDPSKPTVIMLHPFCFDSSWLGNQLSDPRLGPNYNMIAFDSRVAGRSRTRLSGKLDHWVETADLAFACQILHLPPAHLWAEESLATNVALRFAILFPEMCLSLALITVAPPTELSTVFTSLDELMRLWGFAEDLEGLEHANKELLGLTVGYDIDAEEIDEIVAYWQRTYPPFKRSRFMMLGNLLTNRVPLKTAFLANIRQPVMLLHGESNALHPLRFAEELKEQLCNAVGGVNLCVIKGSAGFLSVIPSCASILNKFFVKFLARLPHARSDLRPPAIPINERMKSALVNLAQMYDDQSIASRDPRSPMSFSLVPPSVEKLQTDALRLYARDERKAFSPLSSDGRPIRKYSERKDGHWFSSDSGGMSFAGKIRKPSCGLTFTDNALWWLGGTDFSLLNVGSMPNSSSSPRTRSVAPGGPEPVTLDMIQDSRVRRATFNPHGIDKLVVQGSLSRVSMSTGIPVGKFLS